MSLDPWPPVQVTRLTQLWNDGNSASKIAADLGDGYTRSGVLGKVHRLGLQPRDTSTRFVSGYKARTNAATPRPARSKPPVALPDEPEVLGEPNDFPKHGCLWIAGTVAPGFRCCGQKRHGNSVWCEHHHAKAIAPQRGRNDDNGTNSRSTA